jgi:hypothetical protein
VDYGSSSFATATTGTSATTNSLINNLSNNSSNSAFVTAPTPVSKKQKRGSRKSRRDREWEILEGLRDGQVCNEKPEKYQGFLMKRRKWPMKGWHKVGSLDNTIHSFFFTFRLFCGESVE